MEFEAQFVAVKARSHAIKKRCVGVKARNFVFILVRHQLEQIARHGFGQRTFARHLRSFRRLHLLDPAFVARRVGGVLVFGEEVDAARHHLVE